AFSCNGSSFSTDATVLLRRIASVGLTHSPSTATVLVSQTVSKSATQTPFSSFVPWSHAESLGTHAPLPSSIVPAPQLISVVGMHCSCSLAAVPGPQLTFPEVSLTTTHASSCSSVPSPHETLFPP